MQINDGHSHNEVPADRGLPREILDAFHGHIPPVRTPISYRLGILLVAFVMVVLPLIYLSIIVLVGWAVYYHAVHDTAIVSMGRGRGSILALLIYVAPMVIGAILVLFMFKPLLSRPGKRPVRKPVSGDEEPLLFAFVARVCESVCAPTPRRIEVDEQVNASASFRRGFLSMFGNDLVLTIGMPLVAGLDLRQLAGVLAHEFGHFAQGAGMRLTYVIRTISHWFTRVVYERDEWDEQLVRWSQESDFRIQWILYLARMFVWLTRKILWVLMMVGHAVSGYMLRQMEFDADRHEARLAGSDVFESTSRRIVLLSVASQGAQSDLGDFYREGRLCDDMPKLVLHNIDQFTPETLRKIDQMSDQSKTGWLDTHPCQTDRIASAKAERAAGIFQLEMPASVLFSDYDGLCKRATREFYDQIFGEQLNPEEIFPLDQLLTRQAQEQQDFRALHRYLQSAFRIDRPLRLSSWQFDAPAETAPVIKLVQDARRQVVQTATQYERNYAEYLKAEGTDIETLGAELSSFEAVAGQRLENALRLLYAPEVARQIEQAPQWRQELATVLPVLEKLNDQVQPTSDLGYGNQQLAGLCQQLQQDGNNQSLIGSIQYHMQRNAKLISDIRGELSVLEYPFEHAKGTITLGEFALAKLPDSDNPGGIYEAASGLIESTNRLRARLVGRLCLIAEHVESALGLEPLPEPALDTRDAAAAPAES